METCFSGNTLGLQTERLYQTALSKIVYAQDESSPSLENSLKEKKKAGIGQTQLSSHP